MMLMQYTHRLPADYEMDRIASRAGSLGPDWDLTPGLGFKAFLAQHRNLNGAVGNTYSSLYLWLEDEAATDFLTDDRFRKVVAGFGRPAMETWLPLDVHLGKAETARSVHREDVAVDPDADLAVLRHREDERSRAAIRDGEVFARVAALDLAHWRLTRFTLSARATVRPERGIAYDVLHLARPGIPGLFAAA